MQSQDAEVATEVDRLWKTWRTKGRAARLANTFSVVHGDDLVLYRDCARVTSSDVGGARLVLRLLMEANRQAIEQYAGFASHAAVLGCGERVAAMLAESGAGKTTLAAAGILAGLAYGSDEALCVDRNTGRVLPYAKPLGLSRESATLLDIDPPKKYSNQTEMPLTAEDLGGSVMAAGRRLTDIIVPRRDPKASPALEPLTPSEAVVALLSNSFNHYRDPYNSYVVTSKLGGEARAWTFRYSDAGQSGQALAEFLRSEPV